MKKYFILILIPFVTFSQVDVPDEYWLTDINFDETISSSAFGDDNDQTIVIEFWAKFNEANCFAEWDKIEDALYYRVDISKAPKTKKEYRVRMAPTLLIFKNGVVEETFKAGLDLLLPTNLSEIQDAIREINKQSKF
jgi:thiol-disulfide isomerase/thioredoxin|tara:strand:- start:1442 stop:1852 length:411 start_codon:yes stop_codon:yes gene_type:complete